MHFGHCGVPPARELSVDPLFLHHPLSYVMFEEFCPCEARYIYFSYAFLFFYSKETPPFRPFPSLSPLTGLMPCRNALFVVRGWFGCAPPSVFRPPGTSLRSRSFDYVFFALIISTPSGFLTLVLLRPARVTEHTDIVFFSPSLPSSREPF